MALHLTENFRQVNSTRALRLNNNKTSTEELATNIDKSQMFIDLQENGSK